MKVSNIKGRLAKLQKHSAGSCCGVAFEFEGKIEFRGRTYDSASDLPQGDRGYLLVPAPCKTVVEWEFKFSQPTLTNEES